MTLTAIYGDNLQKRLENGHGARHYNVNKVHCRTPSTYRERVPRSSPNPFITTPSQTCLERNGRIVHTSKATRRTRRGIQRSWNKVALSIMLGHTRIFHLETTNTQHKAPQRTHLPHVISAAVFSHAAWKLLLQIPPSENSLIQKIQKKYQEPQPKSTTHAIHILTATSSQSPAALSSVVHGHQHNVKTKFERVAGTKNRTVYGGALGTVVTKVKIQKPITLNTWRACRNSVCRIMKNRNEAVNYDQTQFMYNAVQLWLLSPWQWRWAVFFLF